MQFRALALSAALSRMVSVPPSLAQNQPKQQRQQARGDLKTQEKAEKERISGRTCWWRSSPWRTGSPRR